MRDLDSTRLHHPRNLGGVLKRLSALLSSSNFFLKESVLVFLQLNTCTIASVVGGIFRKNHPLRRGWVYRKQQVDWTKVLCRLYGTERLSRLDNDVSFGSAAIIQTRKTRRFCYSEPTVQSRDLGVPPGTAVPSIGAFERSRLSRTGTGVLSISSAFPCDCIGRNYTSTLSYHLPNPSECASWRRANLDHSRQKEDSKNDCGSTLPWTRDRQGM